ncbi:hypothetical protein [Klebsiella variicola]|uniref:AbiTii domain-containing protein n=1 Tax=Klebsiella variicola TaxID=244366 RepID=UPI0035B47F61
MNEPMVIRFQRMAIDNETSTTDLLRIAKAIAVKLQLTEVSEWINFELNGYYNNEDLPDYRITKGQLLAHNPINGLIPMTVSNQKDEDFLRTVYIWAPITELALAYGNPKATMTFQFSTELSNELQSGQPDFLRFPILRRIGQSKIINVVEQVRNRLLDWSLELENNGILGENLRFSQQDKDRAYMTTNNFHFNGNITNSGVIGSENHDFIQNNIQDITIGDFGSLQSRLESLGFASEDIQRLKTVLDSDSQPAEREKLLPKIYSWMGSTVIKLVDSSLEKVTPLAIDAICKYVGV